MRSQTSKPPMPLGYLRQEGLRLFVWCNRCSRNRSLEIGPLIAALGPDYPVPGTARRLRCSGCGGRDVETRPDWAPESPGVISRHT